jgi:outer membrane autotransporter protein
MGNVTEDQARRVLDELSGEAHATLKSNLIMLDTAFARRLAGHVSDKSTLRHAFSGGGGILQLTDKDRLFIGKNLWVGLRQGHNTLDRDGNAGRARLHGTELAGGYDADLGNGWLGGFALRLHDGQQDINSRRAETDIRNYTAALYGGKEHPIGPGVLRLLLSGAITRHEMDSDRKIRIGARDQTVKASYEGASLQGTFETAYRFSPMDKLFLEPYVTLGLHNLRMGALKETGGNAALRQGGKNWNHATSALGLRVAAPLRANFTINADLGWQHIHGDTTPESAFAFREGSDKFTIKGASLNRDAVILGLGVGVKVTRNVKIGLRYDGERGNRGQSHGGKATLEMTW